ncbi:uncharacterized protein LOC114846750 isoform X2 [Betta splendens]|uniref:Uncharacterized protein LOC114846750 isoform X2 n=1 Tax=Betta splendens TaxID=158456 RepID=A0A6P7LDL3_BETSP|nr:uncharacterized protein LOC114846750 isoform X2 [Betta splendens]
MMLSLLLLILLLGSNCKASFMGTVVTYYAKTTTSNKTAAVVYTQDTYEGPTSPVSWLCNSKDCGSAITNSNHHTVNFLGNLYEQQYIWYMVPNSDLFQMWLYGPYSPWVSNVDGGRIGQAVAVIDLRKRSDTNKANSSPQTAIIPLRVPSNCQRDFNLLAFDPDGDDVRCRYGNASLSESYTYKKPPFFNLSSSCTLSFSPTSSSKEGAYVVQMVMEDFPKENITLTQTNGSQEVKTNNDAISKIPVQFVVRVDPAVPSCTEGLYLPRILTPIPDRLYTIVNQPVLINITAEALNASLSQVLYSGPSTINLNRVLPGQYVMSWTPPEDNGGESHPICFVVEADNVLPKYHSELRCVIVTVGNATATATATINNSNKAVARLIMRVSSSLPLDDIKNIITQLIKDELTILGLSDVALDLNIVANTTNTGG